MKTWFIPSLAICALTVLEIVALMQGFNGVAFTGVMTLIGGIAGFKLRESTRSHKGE